MATSSLNRFTVPLASDQTSVSQGVLMPKQKWKFRINFENFGVSTPRSELTKQVIDFQRPSVNWDETQLEIYNSRVYIPGKHRWEPITVNLRDEVTGRVSRLVGEQMQKQFDMLQQSSARSGVDFKFTTRCEILDGGNGAHTPNVLETWELLGCFIQSANYNDLNYGTSDPVMITMTIRFDNAVQTPLETSGVGINVGRTLGDRATG